MKKKVKLYRRSIWQQFGTLIIGGGILFAVGMIFFHNVFWALAFTPFAILIARDWNRQLAEKKKKVTLLQFRDFVQSLNVSLKSSSKTLLNCFDDAVKAMEEMYSGKSIFMKKLKKMYNNLHQNQSTRFDQELMRMAYELGDDDIIAFATAIKECYGVNTSGISVVSEKYANLIDQKKNITEEIITMVKSQRIEQMVMVFAPSALLLFLGQSMPTYMVDLYNTPAGRIVMIIGLLLNIGCYYLGNFFMRV